MARWPQEKRTTAINASNPYIASALIVLGAGALGLLCAGARRLVRWVDCWLWWQRSRRGR